VIELRDQMVIEGALISIQRRTGHAISPAP
jgi:hypothetical protein